jgi:hypothetical protein
LWRLEFYMIIELLKTKQMNYWESAKRLADSFMSRIQVPDNLKEDIYLVEVSHPKI